MSNLDKNNECDLQKLIQELELHCGTGKFVILNLSKENEVCVVAAQLKSVKEANGFVTIEFAQTSREIAEAFIQHRVRETAVSTAQPYEKILDDLMSLDRYSRRLPVYIGPQRGITVGKHGYSVTSIAEAPVLPPKTESVLERVVAQVRPTPPAPVPVAPAVARSRKEEQVRPQQVSWSSDKTGFAHVTPGGTVLDGVKHVAGSSLEFVTETGDTLKVEQVKRHQIGGEYGVIHEELDIAIGGSVAKKVDARLISEDGLVRASNIQSVFVDKDRWIVTHFDTRSGKVGDAGEVVRHTIDRTTGKVESDDGSLYGECRTALSAMKKAQDSGNAHIRVESGGRFTTVLYDDAIIIRGDFISRSPKATVYKGWVAHDGLFMFYAPNGRLIQLDQNGNGVPPRET